MSGPLYVKSEFFLRGCRGTNEPNSNPNPRDVGGTMDQIQNPNPSPHPDMSPRSRVLRGVSKVQ